MVGSLAKIAEHANVIPHSQRRNRRADETFLPSDEGLRSR